LKNMKKISSLLIAALICSFASSCDSPATSTKGSPTPAASTTPAATAAPTATPAPTAVPTPSPTPKPTPVPTPAIPLEQQSFDVQISLDNAANPFVQVDGGGSESLPLTTTLNGGRHEFLIFDISSTCKIGKAVTVDKDHTKFKYVAGTDCDLGR
jgi:hypothetical protein